MGHTKLAAFTNGIANADNAIKLAAEINTFFIFTPLVLHLR
jgi:hypothetical protein